MHISLLRMMIVAGMLMLMQGCAFHHSTHHQSRPETSFQRMISDRLYFGRSIPGGGTVSDEDWRKYLAESVTPRFPDGLSVWRAEGQWRGNDSIIVREESFILDLLHADDPKSEQSVQEIIREYKVRFKQEAVLRVRDSVDVQFQ